MARPRKIPQKPEWTGMPNSESALKDIKATILQTHASFQAMENERAQIQDIFSELHTKYGMPRRIFNKLAKFSYYGNANEQFSKEEEIQKAWAVLEQV